MIHDAETSLDRVQPQGASAITTLAAADRAYLDNFLEKRFSLGELKGLAFKLGTNYEAFEHQTVGDLARGLILHYERRNQLDRLMNSILEQRGDDRLVAMLTGLSPSEPYDKVEVRIRAPEDTLKPIDRDEIEQGIARLLKIPREKLILIAMAAGTIRLLFSLPREAATSLVTSKPRDLENAGLHVTSVEAFDSLDPSSRTAWEYIAITKPAESKDDTLRPAIRWSDAMDAVQGEFSAVRSPMTPTSRGTIPVPRSRGLFIQNSLTVLSIVLIMLLTFLTAKLGGPWPIVFGLAYALAFKFRLTFLSRRVRVSGRFLIFLIFWVTAVFVSGRIVYTFLNSTVMQTEIITSRFWTFLLGNNSLIMFWTVVGAIAVPTLIGTLFLLLYGYTAAPIMYSQYEGYKDHEWEAVRSAISIVLGINRGEWIVTDGKAEVHGQSSGSLARFGGPGALIIQEGHAVILEISGKLSRVVGRGITWLKAFERISMVVPLFLRSEKVTVEQVATKNKVLIEGFEVQVFHKVDPGPPEEQIRDGQFAYTQWKLLHDVWSPGGGDWRGAVRSVAETATRDVVGRFDLEDIVPISDMFRTDFKQILTEEMNRVTRDKMGVVVVTVEIGKIKVPKEIERQFMEKWVADWDIGIAQSEREAVIRRGEADAVLLKIKEVAWAEAQKQVIQRVTEGFRDVGLEGPAQVSYIVALRALETLGKMASDPATKILLPNDVLLRLGEMQQALTGAEQIRGSAE